MMARDPRARYVDGHKAEVLLDRVLEDWLGVEEETFFKCMSKAGKKAKKDLQNSNAWEDRTGDYRRGWSIRTKRERYGINVLIYNKLKPSLTHLIEKGHEKGRGTSRANPHPHISIARENAADYLLEELYKNL